MFCTQCGSRLEDGTRFCTRCGAPVQQAEAGDGAAEQPADPATPAGPKAISDKAVETPAGATEVLEPSAQEPGEATEVLAASAESPERPTEALDGLRPTDEIPLVGEYSSGLVYHPYDETRRAADALCQPTGELYSAPPLRVIGPEAPVPARTDPSPEAPAPKRRGRWVAVACGAVALAAVAAVGVLAALGVFSHGAPDEGAVEIPDTGEPIDAGTFPNDIIRGAVLDQLDADGDGRLTAQEAEGVTGLVYTLEGAQFVTEGEEMDVEAIRQEIGARAKQPEAAAAASSSDALSAEGASGSQAAPTEGPSGQGTSGGQAAQAESPAAEGSQPSQEAQGGGSGEAGGGAHAALASLDLFRNMRHLVATDADLDSIDLSGMPNLEYADLRGNPRLTEFDLSQNPSIEVLFCDEDTVVTGLDEAGLYYTDLMTSLEVTGAVNETIQVEYDSHARPISACGYDFAYDEQGRLVRISAAEGEGSWFNAYAYGENGLLSQASLYSPLSVGEPVHEYLLGYDEAGRLTQLANGVTPEGATAATLEDAAVFTYLDGRATGLRSADMSSIYSFNGDGRLAAAVGDKDAGTLVQTTYELAYAGTGAPTEYSSVAATLDGEVRRESYSTAYTEQGAPVKTLVESEYSPVFEVTYTCNKDGYITEIHWGDSEMYLGGSIGKAAYVKRVGRLADRASERYVPTFRFELLDYLPSGFMSWDAVDNWFSTTGSEMPITMLTCDPQRVAKDQLGLGLNMLACPNELALAAYDREHWTDGLNLTAGEQPIAEPGIEDLLAKAEQQPLPVPASAFTEDPVYGPVVEQWLGAVRESLRLNFEDPGSYERKYSLVPTESLYEFDGDDLVVFAYADLNGDGVNELAVTSPSFFTGDGEGVPVLAIYAQRDGEASLIVETDPRHSAWIAADGLVARCSSADDCYAYRWDGAELQDVAGVSFYFTNPPLVKMTMRGENGQETETEVPVEAAQDKVDELRESLPYAQLSWTPIPV